MKIPFPFDFLTRPIRYVEANVYTIIVAEGAYAIANPDSCRLVAKHTDPDVTGITGAPVTATLLQSAKSAGEDFATIHVTAGKPDAVERVYGIALLKTEEAKADWFKMYVEPISDHHAIPTAPFLWLLSIMLFEEPRLIRFRMRYAPHIIGPGPEGSKPMVQMYPTTQATATQMGWQVLAYRTDKNGEGEMYQSPPEWATDVIQLPFGSPGLLFGKEPPLIVRDVPFE